MSSFVIKVRHMCGFSGVKGYVGVRGARGRMGLVGMRQLILSMGLLWMGVHRAATLSERFLFYITHLLKIIVCAV